MMHKEEEMSTDEQEGGGRGQNYDWRREIGDKRRRMRIEGKKEEDDIVMKRDR